MNQLMKCEVCTNIKKHTKMREMIINERNEFINSCNNCYKVLIK